MRMHYDQNNIDCFFYNMSNIFAFALDNGLARISETSVNIENKYVLSTVKKGLEMVENGIDPEIIKTLLETSNLILFKENLDAKDVLLELKLLELVIPYIQTSETDKFLILTSQLCSRKASSVIEVQIKQSG